MLLAWFGVSGGPIRKGAQDAGWDFGGQTDRAHGLNGSEKREQTQGGPTWASGDPVHWDTRALETGLQKLERFCLRDADSVMAMGLVGKQVVAGEGLGSRVDRYLAPLTDPLK